MTFGNIDSDTEFDEAVADNQFIGEYIPYITLQPRKVILLLVLRTVSRRSNRGGPVDSKSRILYYRARCSGSRHCGCKVLVLGSTSDRAMAWPFTSKTDVPGAI